MHPSALPATRTVADDLLTVVVESGDDTTVDATVRLDGEIDLGNAGLLGEVLADLVAQGRHHVTVDLSSVTFVNSTALRVLAAAHNQFLAASGALRLAGVTPRVARLLAITHLDTALFVSGTIGLTPSRHLNPVTP